MVPPLALVLILLLLGGFLSWVKYRIYSRTRALERIVGTTTITLDEMLGRLVRPCRCSLCSEGTGTSTSPKNATVDPTVDGERTYSTVEIPPLWICPAAIPRPGIRN